MPTVGSPFWRSLFYCFFTCWCSWVSVVYHTSCIQLPDIHTSRKVQRPSLEAPRGSKISVKEEAGELRILFPPPSWSSLVGPGTFTVAWMTFTAVWTAGVVSAGAPLMSLFSLLTGMQVILQWPLAAQSHCIRFRTVCICDGHFTDPYSSCSDCKTWLFRCQDVLTPYSHFRSFRILCQQNSQMIFNSIGDISPPSRLVGSPRPSLLERRRYNASRYLRSTDTWGRRVKDSRSPMDTLYPDIVIIDALMLIHLVLVGW